MQLLKFIGRTLFRGKDQAAVRLVDDLCHAKDPLNSR